jgi:hypothetical protein
MLHPAGIGQLQGLGLQRSGPQHQQGGIGIDSQACRHPQQQSVAEHSEAIQ